MNAAPERGENPLLFMWINQLQLQKQRKKKKKKNNKKGGQQQEGKKKSHYRKKKKKTPQNLWLISIA